jgi:hypothetical protein
MGAWPSSCFLPPLGIVRVNSETEVCEHTDGGRSSGFRRRVAMVLKVSDQTPAEAYRAEASQISSSNEQAGSSELNAGGRRMAVSSCQGLHIKNIEPGNNPNECAWFYVQPAFGGTVQSHHIGQELVRPTVCKMEPTGELQLKFGH